MLTSRCCGENKLNQTLKTIDLILREENFFKEFLNFNLKIFSLKVLLLNMNFKEIL